MSRLVPVCLCALSLLSVAGPATGVDLPGTTVPEGFGVNIHFTRAPDAELDQLADIGFRVVRMDMSWASIERRRGEYQFDAYDQLYESMARRGIRCYFILDYANRLYDGGAGPHSDEGIAAFAKACAAAAKHFAGKRIIWEIWNEPNLNQFFKPKADAETYAKIVIAAVDAIRAADPKATVIGPASSTFPWEFYDVLIKRGAMQKFDAISVHPYRQSPPETAARDYQKLRLTLARAGIDKPIISGEWGYSTGWKQMTEEKQAQYLVRQWLSNLANDVNLSIWYDWKDDGADPKEPEHHFGSVYRDLKDKPAAKAARVLTKTLGGYRYLRRLAEGTDRDYLLVFARGDDTRLAAWTTDDASTVSLNLEHPGVKPEAVDMDGNPIKLQFDAAKSALRLELKRSPQYVKLNGLKLQAWGPRPQIGVVGRMREARWDPGEPLAGPGSPKYRIMTAAAAGGSAQDAVMLSPEPKVAWAQVAGQEELPAAMERYGDRRDPLGTARIRIVNINAVAVDLIPSAFDETIALVRNPSGVPFAGKLQVSHLLEQATAPVSFAKGQVEQIVAMGAPQAAPDQVVLMDDSGRVLARHAGAAWERVSTIGYSAWTEGDKSVSGQIAISRESAPELPGPGNTPVLKITYRLGNGWRYALVSPRYDLIDFHAKELGLWLYGDGSHNILRTRVADKTGQIHQFTYGPITWTGWKWITIPLLASEAYHFGGANDGAIHFPIKFSGMVLIDNAKRITDRDLLLYVAMPALR